MKEKQKFIKVSELRKLLGYEEVVLGKYGVFVRGKIKKK